MRKLLGYGCVLWDWNGTLLNDALLTHSVSAELLKERFSLEMTFDAFREHFRMPIGRFYESIGLTLDPATIEALGKYFHDRYEPVSATCELHPAAARILRALKAEGIPQHVLSALPYPLLIEALEARALMSLLSGVWAPHDMSGGGKIAQGKACIEAVGLPPAKVVLIGDTDHDADVAKEIGCDCILISDGFQSRNRLESTGFPVFDSLEELLV